MKRGRIGLPQVTTLLPASSSAEVEAHSTLAGWILKEAAWMLLTSRMVRSWIWICSEAAAKAPKAVAAKTVAKRILDVESGLGFGKRVFVVVSWRVVLL